MNIPDLRLKKKTSGLFAWSNWDVISVLAAVAHLTAGVYAIRAPGVPMTIDKAANYALSATIHGGAAGIDPYELVAIARNVDKVPTGKGVCTQLAFGADGKSLVWFGPESGVNITDVTEKGKTRELKGAPRTARQLCLSRDGRFIAVLADDARLRQRMGRLGRERVETDFSVSAWAETFVSSVTGPSRTRARSVWKIDRPASVHQRAALEPHIASVKSRSLAR